MIQNQTKKSNNHVSFSPWTYFFFFCWIFSLHLLGIYLFSRGFFLTRYEIEEKSNCGTLPNSSPSSLTVNNYSNSSNTCWQEKIFSKVIIIVIDALRYDFLVWNETSHKLNTSNPNENKLPIINYLLTKEPNHSFLFNGVADPPSVTMQRIKGITTGGLPTFIDIKKNFDSNSISEDNLIQQFLNNNYSLTFMGDDTWDNLFPSYFNKSFPYPSFNVKDLHTVDNGVISHLIPEITGKDPWNVMIAHFLGVDHVGHRFDSTHPMMAPKLGQMNKVIEEVVAVISSDTLLLVMGDHGSTNDGNHGGSSPEEVNAGLFFYSKKNINFQPILPRPRRTISQIDLVPTVSLLLGIPIPFGNLGIGIPELLFFHDFPTLPNNQIDSSSIEKLVSHFNDKDTSFFYKTILKGVESIYLNCWQMFRYVETYSKISDEFPHSKMKMLQSTFFNINEKYKQITESKSNTKKLFEIFLEYYKLQNEISQMCREAWIVFDEFSMTVGEIILLISCFFLLFQFFGSQSKIEWKWVFLGSTIFAGFFSISIHLIFETSIIPLLCLGYTIGSSLIFLFYFSFSIESIQVPEKIILIPSAFTFLAIILQGFGLTSNSFIEAQDKVVRFLLFSLGMVILLTSFQKSFSSNTPPLYKSVFFWVEWISFMINIKLSVYSTGGIYESIHVPLGNFVLESILPLLFIFFLLQFLKTYASIDSHLELWMIFQVFLVGLFWTLQRTTFLENFPFGTIILPWIVYISSLYLFIKHLFFQRNDSQKILVSHLTLSVIPYPSLLLIFGIKSSIALSLLFFQSFLFIHLLSMIYGKKDSFLWPAVWWGFFTIQFFYTTGHTFDFNSLHWAAAFVGFEEMNWVGGGTIMILETFGSQILFSFSLPILFYWLTTQSTFNFKLNSISLFFLVVLYLFFFSFNSTLTTIFVHIQRRHLMVWRIFAPKYIFEGLILLIVDTIILLTLFINFRILSPNSDKQKQ